MVFPTYFQPPAFILFWGVLLSTQSSKGKNITSTLKHSFFLNSKWPKSYEVKHVHILLDFVSPVILLPLPYYLCKASPTSY